MGVVKTTAVQDKVLELLRRRWRERGSQPNLNEVAGELGMQYMSLRQHLEALDRKGYLTFESQGRGKPPVIRLAEKGPVRLEPHEGVPLLGDRAACTRRWSTARAFSPCRAGESASRLARQRRLDE